MEQVQGGTIPQPVNALGLAGFICSLVGIPSVGLLSVVGLILSLVALRQEPRGFAIAGVILGALGLCGWVVALFVFGAAILAALGLVAALAITEPERTELSVESIALHAAIESHRGRTGSLPESLDSLNLAEALRRDPWGNLYRYEVVPGERGFRIMTGGHDGLPDTEDDLDIAHFEHLEGGGGR